MLSYNEQLENRVEELEKQIQDILKDRDRNYYPVIDDLYLVTRIELNGFTGLPEELHIDILANEKSLFTAGHPLKKGDIYLTINDVEKVLKGLWGFVACALKALGVESHFEFDIHNHIKDDNMDLMSDMHYDAFSAIAYIIHSNFLECKTKVTFKREAKYKPSRWSFFKRFIRGY